MYRNLRSACSNYAALAAEERRQAATQQRYGVEHARTLSRARVANPGRHCLLATGTRNRTRQHASALGPRKSHQTRGSPGGRAPHGPLQRPGWRSDALAAGAAHDWPKRSVNFKKRSSCAATAPSRRILHKKLGLIECQMGDLDRGEKELRLAQALKPSDQDIERALDRIAAVRRRQAEPYPD
jgi:hypothetical protein